MDYETFFYSGSLHYVVQPMYKISQKDIMSMTQKGIIKIRVETNIDVQDRIEKDCKRFTKLFIKAYNNITKSLRTNKTLYSNF